MVTLSIILLSIVALALILIGGVLIFGSVFILVFGDIIVCALIMAFIFKLILKK